MFISKTSSHVILFFLQGRPNRPGVPAKIRTDYIPAAITMVTDAKLKAKQGSGKNINKQANKRETLLYMV